MDYLKYPKLEPYRIIYHSGYWDGPLSGMLLYNLERLWFQCCDDMDNHSDEPEFAPWYLDDPPEDFEVPWCRRYLVYRLDPASQAQIDTLHAEWQALGGYHSDHIPGLKETIWYNPKLYEVGAIEAFRQRRDDGVYGDLDLTKQEIVGWVER